MLIWHGLPILIGASGSLLFFRRELFTPDSSPGPLLFAAVAGGLVLILGYFLFWVMRGQKPLDEVDAWER